MDNKTFLIKSYFLHSDFFRILFCKKYCFICSNPCRIFLHIFKKIYNTLVDVEDIIIDFITEKGEYLRKHYHYIITFLKVFYYKI